MVLRDPLSEGARMTNALSLIGIVVFVGLIWGAFTVMDGLTYRPVVETVIDPPTETPPVEPSPSAPNAPPVVGPQERLIDLQLPTDEEPAKPAAVNKGAVCGPGGCFEPVSNAYQQPQSYARPGLLRRLFGRR